MKTPAPPPAPDPVATANAQGAQNLKAAQTQFGLNAVNQVTPQGSLSYKQIGNWEDGTPRYETTQSQSDAEKAIYDTDASNRLKLGQTAGQQIDRVSSHLANPINFDGAPALPKFTGDTDAIESRLMELGRKRLDPMLAQRRAATETQLTNQGIGRGTEAWTNGIDELTRGENDAYNEMLLRGRGQAFGELESEFGSNMAARQQAIQEILTQRNQPVNEISALTSGSQVSMPSWVNTPQSRIDPADIAGLYGQQWQGQMQGWNAKNQANQAMIGGLFGLGGAALGGWAKGGFAKPGFMN